MHRCLVVSLLLFAASACAPDQPISAAPSEEVLVVAALDSMYWMQEKGIYSKESLDDLKNNPQIIEAIESDLGFKLSDKIIERIIKQRQNLSDSYTY